MNAFPDTPDESGLGLLSQLADQLPQVLEREPAGSRNRILRELCTRLRLLAPYLEPCYRPTLASSLLQIASQVKASDDRWRRVREGLASVSRWFSGWRERLEAMREKPRPADAVLLLHDLNRMLIFTSLLGMEL